MNTPALKTLYCSENEIERLDAGHLECLEHLDCSKNQLKVLHLGSVNHLENLNCSENKIEKLSFGQADFLVYLKEALGNKPAQRRLSHNLLAVKNLGRIKHRLARFRDFSAEISSYLGQYCH